MEHEHLKRRQVAEVQTILEELRSCQAAAASAAAAAAAAAAQRPYGVGVFDRTMKNTVNPKTFKVGWWFLDMTRIALDTNLT